MRSTILLDLEGSLVLDLVVDHIVEREDRPHHRANVDDHQLVISVGDERLAEVLMLGERAQVRQQVEHVLQLAEDGVVHRELAHNHPVEVAGHVLEVVAEALEALELTGDPHAQHSGRSVVDVAEQVLDADLLGLLGLDLGRDVHERTPSRRAVGLDLVDGHVCVGGDPDLLGHHVHDQQQRIRGVSLEQLVYLQICRPQFGSRVVPANELLVGVDFSEHVLHSLYEIVVQKPDIWVLAVLLERDCERVGDPHRPVPGISQDHSHDSAVRVLGHAIVVVHDAQQHQRSHRNLIDWAAGHDDGDVSASDLDMPHD